MGSTSRGARSTFASAATCTVRLPVGRRRHRDSPSCRTQNSFFAKHLSNYNAPSSFLLLVRMLLVVRPGAPSSVLAPVAMPGAPTSEHCYFLCNASIAPAGFSITPSSPRRSNHWQFIQHRIDVLSFFFVPLADLAGPLGRFPGRMVWI